MKFIHGTILFVLVGAAVGTVTGALLENVGVGVGIGVGAGLGLLVRLVVKN
jgi:hypothetical protein